MKSSFAITIGFLLGFGGCRVLPEKDLHDTANAVSDPWLDLPNVDLEPFRQILKTSVRGSTSPIEMLIEPHHGQVFIRDYDAGKVWALDAQYHHDARVYCIDPQNHQNSIPQGPDGECPTGTHEVARGRLEALGPPVAMAMSPETPMLAILGRAGQISFVPTDPEFNDPIEHMKEIDGPILENLNLPMNDTLMGWNGDLFAVSKNETLSIFDDEGALFEQQSFAGNIQDVIWFENNWAVLTTSGFHYDGLTTEGGGLRLIPWQERLWIIDSDSIRDSTEALTLASIKGPAVVFQDNLLVVTESGLTKVTPTGETIPLLEGTFRDVGTNQAGEVVLLHDDGTITVYVDETDYGEDTELNIWIATFIERPRFAAEAIPCRSDNEGSIRGFIESASNNAELIADMPIQSILGVTPSHVRRATECGEQEALEPLFDAMEPGLLFHDYPKECESDPSCHEDALANDLAAMNRKPLWTSGLSPHDQLDVDWVNSLKVIGAPNLFTFFGMSIRPDVPHDTDLRAKDAWPLSLGNGTETWRTDHSSDIALRNNDGWLHLLPGNNVPAFNLGACPNLFINECHPLNRGGGLNLDNEDTETLRLLLHRALVSADRPGTHTWSFHLPDIGLYDYTSNCTVSNRIWSGDDCSGAHLQAWVFDVQQRFVSKGLIRWSTPSTLELE
jgi:hypothetical protein